MTTKRWVAALGAVLMAGCSTQGSYTVQQVAEQLPVGARMEIATPFTYPGGRTTLWFQAGEIKPSRGLNLWVWHCSLDLHFSARSEQAREYGSGSFIITGIREERLAGVEGWALRRASFFERDEDYMLGIVFHLSAPDQPEVRQLRCERRFEDWSRERALSLADLQETLGGYLVIAAPGS